MNLILGVIATCYMSGFIKLPSKIKGKVVVTLKNHIVLKVYNKKKTESVEITFVKNKCKVK